MKIPRPLRLWPEYLDNSYTIETWRKSFFFLFVGADRILQLTAPGHQFFENRAVVTGKERNGGHSFQYIPKVIVGIHSIQLCGLCKGIDHCTCMGAYRLVGEQPVLATNHKGFAALFGQIVRKAAASIFKISQKIWIYNYAKKEN